MAICIHICSGREWRSTKEIFQIPATHLKQQALGEYFEIEINTKKCIVYHSGPTKTRSAAACQHAIDKWSPEMICVLGTCGCVSKSLEIFDVIMANKTVQYDCQTFMNKDTNTFYEPMITNIDIPALNTITIRKDIKIGTIGTADRDLDYETANSLRKENVLAVDWESGAISKICDLNNVKCVILRGVTDKPTEHSKSDREKQSNDYKQNTSTVMKKLFDLLREII